MPRINYGSHIDIQFANVNIQYIYVYYKSIYMYTSILLYIYGKQLSLIRFRWGMAEAPTSRWTTSSRHRMRMRMLRNGEELSKQWRSYLYIFVSTNHMIYIYVQLYTYVMYIYKYAYIWGCRKTVHNLDLDIDGVQKIWQTLFLLMS